MLLDEERETLKKLYDSMKQVVTQPCTVPAGCMFCALHDICKKSGKLFREVENKLRENGENI